MTVPETNNTQQYARLRKRAAAFGLDFIFIGGYILVLLAVGIGINAVAGGIHWLRTPLAMDGLAFVSLVLPVILYFSLQEGSAAQATWGKRRVGIRVTGSSGERIGWGRSVLRSLVKFLPWQVAHTCVIRIWFGDPSPGFLVGAAAAQGLALLYIACIWLGRSHRAPYDWLAGTFVISTREHKEARL